jgi:hypothetical protein
MFATMAQFEREVMLERQRIGIARAKSQGKYRGRAPTARAKSDEVLALKAKGVGPMGNCPADGYHRNSAEVSESGRRIGGQPAPRSDVIDGWRFHELLTIRVLPQKGLHHRSRAVSIIAGRKSGRGVGGLPLGSSFLHPPRPSRARV